MASNEIPRSYDPLVQLVGTPARPQNVPSAVPGFKDKWNTAKWNYAGMAIPIGLQVPDDQVTRARSLLEAIRPPQK